MRNIIINLTLLFFLGLISINNSFAKNTPGVNKYAWLASLQTIKFMPLNSADPFSGVIITDWYSVTPEVRYKLDIYVFDGILNGRSVHVSAFKQIKEKDKWLNAQISKSLATSIEEAILNQAKLLRANSQN